MLNASKPPFPSLRLTGKSIRPVRERSIDLLRPFDAEKMTAWKVDKAVGKVKNDKPELTEPASTAPHG
ncbi:MAG TPA: hypothetical protein VK638_03020 [Edaphobacter sp.]|nr:hypothetical protein [Edaphobacter sp.]